MFFEDAVHPTLSIEGIFYRQTRERVNGRMKNVNHFESAILLNTYRLDNIDLINHRYNSEIDIDMAGLRARLGRNWRNAEITVQVCNDTNDNGRCSDEDSSQILSLGIDSFTARRIPRSIVLDVWSGRHKTLRDDPRSCEKQISPIVMDMNGDGFKLDGPETGVSFDLENSGQEVWTGWTQANSDDAFLVRDLSANGNIDSGAEMFGTATVLKSGKPADNGFTALRELDSNDDGAIDAQDKEWKTLRVWFDKNHNGRVDRNELFTLDQMNITWMSLDYIVTKEVDPFGNQTKLRSLFYRRIKGKEVPRTMIDVWFNTLDDY